MDKEEIFDGEFYTLTDDEGNESEFELIGTLEVDGATYLALVPVEEEDEDSDEEEEYVILKQGTDDDGETLLATIDDDDEFERIADMFDEEFAKIDYDSIDEEDK